MPEILEGWKQVADFVGYSESYLRKLWRLYPIHLAYWRGPGTRMRMTKQEAHDFATQFKKPEIFPRAIPSIDQAVAHTF